MKRTFKIYLLSFVAAAVSAALYFSLTYFSGSIADSVREAVKRCLDIMIPSLFAVTALSNLLIGSGAYRLAAKIFRPVSKFVFRLPPELFIIFLISNVSGYPIGIKLLSDLYGNGITDKKSAELASCFCYCGGPAFYTSVIGLALFGDIRYGLAVFASVSGANLIIAFLIGHIFCLSASENKAPMNLSADLLDRAVISAGRTMFVICSFIIAFSVPMAVIEGSGIIDFICKKAGAPESSTVLVRSLFEISNISSLKGSPYGLLPYISAVCSFGGLCIVFQVSALRHKKLSLVPFFVSRIPAAALSFLICRLIGRSCFPKVLPAVSEENHIFVRMNNFTPSFCLIMMILILNLKKRLAFSEGV